MSKKEILLNDKYRMACRMICDLSNALMEVEDFATPESVNISIEVVLEHGENHLASMLSTQYSGESH